MKNALILVVLGTFLAGCTTDKFVPGPEVDLTTNYKHRAGMRGETVDPTTRWWANFGDANLNRLVDDALAQNLSIESARERITVARLSAQISRSAYWPAVEAEASAVAAGQRTRGVTTNTSSRSIGLAGAWTINPFASKKTAEREAANISAEKEALNGARLAIIAGMANAYLTAQGLGQQIAISQKSLSVQNETSSITRAKVEAGSASTLDSTRAAAQAALTSADIPSLQQARDQAINQIALLLGKQPAELDNLFTKYRAVKRPKVKFSEGMPVDLLRNRPDIRQVEQELIAAVADIGVAEADLWPSLTLSGSLRATSTRLTTMAWSFGPSINLPIFDRGVIKASIDLSKSTARLQYLAYRQTVIAAVGEVEDALYALRQERTRYSRLSVAVTQLRRAEQLARELNDAGTTEFSEVLDAQSSVYGAEMQLAVSAMRVSINYVALCQALGGGWDGETDIRYTAAAAR